MQFDVYENTHPNTRTHVPYLLDVQHPLHERLHSRMIVPLIRDAQEVKDLYIPITIRGERVVAAIPEMGGISVSALGKKVDNLANHSSEIINAIDLLITGF
jgi:toxin CcdB